MGILENLAGYTAPSKLQMLPRILLWGEKEKMCRIQLEIRSVERGICPIAPPTINERTVPIVAGQVFRNTQTAHTNSPRSREKSREKANFSGLSIWPILTIFMARRVSETPS